MWFGALFLLQNLGIIAPITWSIVWPVIIIIIGLSFKHCKYLNACGSFGNKCGMSGCAKCGGNNAHKCEGVGCGECKN